MRRITARQFAPAAVLWLVVAGCGGGSLPTAGNSQSRVRDGTYTGHGAFINPISFSVSNSMVSGLHGLVQVTCIGASGPLMPQQDEFADANAISVDSAGHFSDDHQYAVGNGTWTLHVEGALAGDGTATGFLSVLGVGCSTSTNGWAAALPDLPLPAIPTYTPPAGAACSPEPCGTQRGTVTMYVQDTAAVTASDDPSVEGIDVTATFVSEGTNGVPIQGHDFEMKFGDGDVADSSGHQFVDSTGNEVPCVRPGAGLLLAAGQQATDVQICLAETADETGQQMTLTWAGLVGTPITIPLGAAP